jgi:hypothetical protein
MAAFTDAAHDFFLYFRLGSRTPLSPHCWFVGDEWTRTHTSGEATGLAMGEKLLTENLPEAPEGAIRICVVSDTHERHETLTVPPCDILIHSGDILMSSIFKSRRACLAKYEAFNDWIGTLPAKRTIVIGGNHDHILESLSAPEAADLLSHVTYYMDNALAEDVSGVRFFCSSTSKGHSGNAAWQSEASHADAKRTLISSMGADEAVLDLLITHGPCRELRSICTPRVHIWGHCHDHYGVSLEQNNTLSICASIMDTKYEATRYPIVFDLPLRAV